MEPVVEEAIRKTDANSQPDLSATWRRAGMAMQTLDRHTQADAYFEKALAADPNGRWSAGVKTALEQKSLWRA